MKRNYTIPTANSFSTDDSHDEVQSESYSCVKRPSQNIQNDSTLSSIILNPNFLFVRKLQLKYVGTFAVTVKYLPTFGGSELSSENSLKKKYFCHSFDKGTLWSAKVQYSMKLNVDSVLPFLLTHDETSAQFVHDDLSRKSCNKVRIDFPLGRIEVEKPGKALDTIGLVEREQPFFLQDTAVKRVAEFFHQFTNGGDWICERSLLHSSKMAPTQFPEDFQYLASRKTSDNPVCTNMNNSVLAFSGNLKIGSTKSLSDLQEEKPNEFAEIVNFWDRECAKTNAENEVHSLIDSVSFDTKDEACHNQELYQELNRTFTLSNQTKTEINIQEKDFKIVENFDDFYICVDCDPMRLLENTDRLSDHFTEKSDHFNINPICFYNKFSLKIRDIGKMTHQLSKSNKRKKL